MFNHIPVKTDRKEKTSLNRYHRNIPKKTIRSYAFVETMHRSITVQGTTLVFQSHAFYQNPNLTNIVLPNSIREIQKNAFDDNRAPREFLPQL